MRGDRLRTEREAAGFTQEEVAEKLNISLRSLIRYEDGANVPSDILVRISELFACTADYLLGLVDERSATLSTENLTPLQRRLLAAIDAGNSVEAMEVLLRIMRDAEQAKHPS